MFFTFLPSGLVIASELFRIDATGDLELWRPIEALE